MFQKIFEWIRKVVSRMIEQSGVKKAIGADIALSSVMAEAIQRWARMYENKASWLSDYVKSMSLPASIASEIARSITIEMKVNISGGTRAEYLNKQVQRIVPMLRHAVEFGSAKGGLIFKPYVSGEDIEIDLIQADQFYPVSFDGNGNITAVVFADQRTIGRKFYTRLEYHSLTGTNYMIRNVAFVSNNRDSLGDQVSLASVEDWKDIRPESHFENVEKPLFGYFRYPLANNIDSKSPLGVSCYSRAEQLIEYADKQWSDLLWEFESGQRAIYVDSMALGKTEDGSPALPAKRLYRSLMGAGAVGDENLFKDWSPTFREQSILSGLDAILKKIEFTCGLAYGTLSDPNNVDKTATEIASSKQRTYSTVVDGQKALQTALEQLIYAIDAWATISNKAPVGTFQTSFDFDDSVIVDKEAQFAQFTQDLRLVSTGIMSKLEWRMRNFNEDEETARKMLEQARSDQPEDMFSGA